MSKLVIYRCKQILNKLSFGDLNNDKSLIHLVVSCKEDVEQVECFASPCDVETCPNFEEAKCV